MKTQMVLLIILALLAAVAGYSDPVGVQARPADADWPIEGWQSSTPEEQGMDSAKLAEALLTIRQQNMNVHSLLLVRNNSILVDAYFYPYDGATVHDVASVTKSVMTTLIGIAADQGKLNLDDPMVSFFPDRTIANRDALKERITVRHLASMTSGLDCTAERDEATLQEMWTTPDWVQFTLDREVVWEPGTQFVYCSPGMHLLSAILQQATGMTALDFARQYLFEPLGIPELIWPDDPQGYSRGWGDLYLHPHDMAKLGYLWLNQGVWEGEQIVSREWVEDSVTIHINAEGYGDDYGYGWWVARDNPPTYSAQGRGGQRIIVIPDLSIILVTTGGGFEMDEVEPLLVAALGDMEQPLPANPAGVAHLEAAVATVAQAPDPEPPMQLPPVAAAISGETFFFEPNPAGLESLRLEFDDSAEAVLQMASTGVNPVALAIGLDGVYRLVPGEYDLPQGLRGYWADAQTFVLERDAIANNEHFAYRMRFEGDHVTIEGQQTTHELTMTLEGSLQNP